MRKSFLTVLACLYLLGLWIYQLPISPVERILMTVFRPIQNVSFTNRQYRMYAPGPRVRKKIPSLVLKTSLTPIRFMKYPPGIEGNDRIWGFLSRERWENFIDHLVKSLDLEWDDYPPEEGREVFRRFALDLCRRASDSAEQVRSVGLQYRLVDLSDFRGDIPWETPVELGKISCP